VCPFELGSVLEPPVPPSRYTRRSALRLSGLGLVSAVAGCSTSTADKETTPTTANGNSATSETSPSPSQTLSVGETATSSDGVVVTISEPQVRKIILTPDVVSSVHAYPAGKTNSLFLAVSVSTQGTDITSLQLAPLLDGTRQESQTYRHASNSESSGKVSFQLPIAQAQSGAVEWRPSSDEQYRWQLPDSVVRNIGASPRFKLEDFAVPETITRGNSFTASLTVTNTGERDGHFLAVVLDGSSSSVPLVSEFMIPISVGQTVTHNLSGRSIEGERSSMTAILDWGINELQRSFSISE
jgi:hypothetical protein